MNPQDQENLGQSSTMDDIDQAVNRHDQSIVKPDEAAGSVSSNQKMILKINNYRVPKKSAVEPSPPPAAADDQILIKSHHCKECNKSFSSGKALGGHMSSAHVQPNKDYSFKKQKPKMHIKTFGSGPEDHVCIECGKCFPSQKSLYGHMRCHPDRDYRGMVEPKIESSQASIEPGFDYTGLNQDEDGAVNSGPDKAPVDFVYSLKAWPVKARRGRPARIGTVSPPITKSPAGSGSEEDEEITAGHQLLRLLNRSQKIGGVEVDHSGPASDDGVNSKKRGMEYPVEKLVLTGVEANHGPGQEMRDWDEARDCKRPRANDIRSPKLKIWNTNGKIEGEDVGKGKGKIVDVGKGKAKIVEDGPESEEDRWFGAINVLVKGKLEKYQGQPDSQNPVPENNCSFTQEKLVSPAIQQKDDSGSLSNPGKHICSTCKKVFSSPQALGGHRSSHKKLMVSIINTADDVNGHDTKLKMNNVANGGVRIDGGDEKLHICKVCNKVYATARALGGHKKCHNSNNTNSGNTIGDDIDSGNDKEKDSDMKGGDEEKAVKGFDLNMMPDDDESEAAGGSGDL